MREAARGHTDEPAKAICPLDRDRNNTHQQKRRGIARKAGPQMILEKKKRRHSESGLNQRSGATQKGFSHMSARVLELKKTTGV